MSRRSALAITSPAAGFLGSAEGGTRSGGWAASSPSARTCLGTNSPRFAPALHSTASTRSSILVPPSTRSTSISRNFNVVLRPSSTLTVSSATSASTLCSLSWISYARRTVRTTAAGSSGAPRWYAVTSVNNSAGISLGDPGRDSSGGQLDRPGLLRVFATPVAQGHARPRQAPVGGIVVRGAQGDGWQRDHPTARWRGAAEIGHGEPVLNLQLPLFLQHARHLSCLRNFVADLLGAAHNPTQERLLWVDEGAFVGAGAAMPGAVRREIEAAGVVCRRSS